MLCKQISFTECKGFRLTTNHGRISPGKLDIRIDCASNRNMWNAARRASFNSLQQWVADARALASPDLVIVVVGNKLDEEDNREVDYLEAARWAKENGGSTPIPRMQKYIPLNSQLC